MATATRKASPTTKGRIEMDSAQGFGEQLDVPAAFGHAIVRVGDGSAIEGAEPYESMMFGQISRARRTFLGDQAQILIHRLLHDLTVFFRFHVSSKRR